jgi:two-component system CheB/CheR fusion protein
VDELSQANNDINNLLASTEIGTIFLDTNFHIKRFTPPMTKIFNLIQTDFGRPISDITTTIINGNLHKNAKEVLNTLIRRDVEVQDNDGNWYVMSISPYRTTENVIDGIVMTFVDITKIKDAENAQRLATVVNDSFDAITIQDFMGNIRAWNRGATELYGWTETEALKKNIQDIIPANKRKETRAFLEKLQSGETVKTFKTKRKTKEGKILDIWLTVTVINDNHGKPVQIATTERNLAWLPKD